MLWKNVKSLSTAFCICLVVPRRIISAARNQLGLVVYYTTAEIIRCSHFIFRANFRGACSPISSLNSNHVMVGWTRAA